MNSNLRFLAPTALSLWDTCLLPTLKHADEGVMVCLAYEKTEILMPSETSEVYQWQCQLGLCHRLQTHSREDRPEVLSTARSGLDLFQMPVCRYKSSTHTTSAVRTVRWRVEDDTLWDSGKSVYILAHLLHTIQLWVYPSSPLSRLFQQPWTVYTENWNSVGCD